MAVAALLLWLCTAAIGSYLLVTAVHAGNTGPEPGDLCPSPPSNPRPPAPSRPPPAAGAAGPATPASPAKPARNDRDLLRRRPCGRPGASPCPA